MYEPARNGPINVAAYVSQRRCPVGCSLVSPPVCDRFGVSRSERELANGRGNTHTFTRFGVTFISERELTFSFAIYCRPSVCRLSVCLSVTFVRPTQAVQIFGNISAALGTLATR